MWCSQLILNNYTHILNNYSCGIAKYNFAKIIFKPKSNFHTLTRKKGNNTDKSEVHAKTRCFVNDEIFDSAFIGMQLCLNSMSHRLLFQLAICCMGGKKELLV